MLRALAIVALLIGLGEVPLGAQNTDSLLQVLRNMPEDTTRLPVLQRLFQQTLREDPRVALAYAQDYLHLVRHQGTPLLLAKAENQMGIPLTLMGDHAQALEYYLRALAAFEALDEQEAVALLYSSVGNAHLGMGDPQRAAGYFRKAMDLYGELDLPAWEAGMAQELARAYRRMDMTDSVAVLTSRATGMYGEKGGPHAAMALSSEAGAQLAAGDHSNAAGSYRKVLQMPGSDDPPFRCALLLGLGKALSLSGDPAGAEQAIRDALALAQGARLKESIADAYRYLAEHEQRHGRPDSAFIHLKEHIIWRDSVAAADRMKLVAEAQERFESGRKDAEIEQQRTLLERRTWSMRIISGVALVLLLAAFLVWRAYRSARRSSVKLADQMAITEHALTEKELLLRELHHRVKNNMQTVMSLLRIQQRSALDGDTRTELQEAIMRVKSLALVHQDLYKDSAQASVHMDEFITKLARALLRSHGAGDRISLVLQVEPVVMDIDTAVPIGLILNELVTNALKHAFPNGRSGSITISLRDRGDLLVLKVHDDGVGHPGNLATAEERPLSGAGIIRTFAEVLKADCSILNDGGTSVNFAVRHFKRA